ncbi:hypothetical protein ACFFF5_17795 [Lederbergia wuyishanensis]|uniref:Solute-binding protein n=1 Tax=Lederbergia wuyishanensis TaxID=1347903 RepID=A0ABU0D4H3_9BACI|nr:hypothetical protein [Lederbergia wuyishanensis]MCJ8008120.1 hypothetical protein [Lederbergia wuyishanensis]MDQ0343294.1 putative solute-binding protein [Lederbergia wuyishanensis]
MSDKNDLVIINLDRPRVLRFGHKALKTLTALTGMTFDDIDLENFDLETIEKVFYCGLLSDAKENNETLKLEDMEDLLDKANNYGELLEKMTLAFNAAFGQMAEEQKNFQRIVE